MKLETSVELLERVRAKYNVSWYRLAKLIPAAENTVANWRHGRSTIDRKFVGRIAELLDESPEYVLLCLEHEREPSPELRKIWKRLAALMTPKAAASVLLTAVSLGGFLAPSDQRLGEVRSVEHFVQVVLCLIGRGIASRIRHLLAGRRSPPTMIGSVTVPSL
jgi:transcriptional regulator with XRE-family HTH domain